MIGLFDPQLPEWIGESLTRGVPAMWVHAGLGREEIVRELDAVPGDHLVFVRYRPGHDPSREWVYNAADIDRAHVVWAREVGEQEDAALRRYFPDRRVWLLEPDDDPPRLTEFAGGAWGSGGEAAERR